MDIDLNCDLGEGVGNEAVLMPLITSANIACGFHAGDPATAREALKLAQTHGVRVGAHPSYPDRASFGRHEMERTADQIFEDCVYQVGALAGLARAVGVPLDYVKPHGALYNRACRDEATAKPLVAACAVFGLPVMGLPESALAACATERIGFIAEGFADRRYRPDGSLVPRTDPAAFVESPEAAVAQAEGLIRTKGIRSLCVHGDNPEALAFVRALRTALQERGFVVRPFVGGMK